MTTVLSCEEADALLAIGALSGVPPAEEEALRRHLVECPQCADSAQRHARVAALLPLQLDAEEPPPQLRRRLMATVYAEAAASRAPTPSWPQRLWTRLPRSRALTVAIAAVAVVLAGVLASRLATPEVSELVTTAGGASIHLYTDQQDHLATLEVSGLPAPPAGTSVYEVWLVPGGGAAHPAAYLEQQPGGGYSAAVVGGLSGYATLAISLEPGRGDAAPRGPIVASVHLDD
ncbi:MAG: anti-sigma factor [Candidatus Dormibacteria bacterium]